VIVTVGASYATHTSIHVPAVGPWWADLQLADDAALSGRVELVLAPPDASKAITLSGTVVPDRAGTFGLRRAVRIIGGAAGWASPAPARAWHSDAKVSAARVARDTAGEVGEVLGTAPAGTVGVSFTREAGPASAVLEAVRGGTPWWVGFDGVTHVAARPVRDSSAPVLKFDPLHRFAVLPCDDPAAVFVGARLSDRLDAPQVVTSYEMRVTPEEARVYAWCGEGRRSPVADALAAVVRAVIGERLLGTYSYRVRAMAADRVVLVSSAAGLPDLPLVDQWCAPSVHAQLTPGSEVAVVFLNGDRGRPAIIGAAPKGSPGFLATRLDLGDATSNVARVGDSVTNYFPPVIGATVPIVLNMAGLTSVGIIQSGAARVRA